MSESEQAEAALRTVLAMPAVAAMIAKDARENLGGLDVVSVGSVFAREIDGVMCHLVVAIVPDRDGKDFVPSQVILDVTQNYMLAAVHRMTLISSLEEHFARVQVFGTELALAKYCQKEWPSDNWRRTAVHCSEVKQMFTLYLLAVLAGILAAAGGWILLQPMR